MNIRGDLKDWVNKPELILALIALLILTIIISLYNPALGLISLLISIYTAYRFIQRMKNLRKEYVRERENLEEAFSDATRSAVFGMPFPISLLKSDGEIIWYNSKFKNLFGKEDILNDNISDHIPQINSKQILEEENNSFTEVLCKGEYYKFYYNIVETYNQDNSHLIILYGVNSTEDEMIKQAYEDESLVVAVAEIDNYEEVHGSVDDVNRPLIYASIDKIISESVIEYGGFSRKYENDRYLIIMDQKALKQVIKDNFPVVNRLKEIEGLGSLVPTMSVGIGANHGPPLEVYKVARLAIDVALGRGGDQIVINDGDNLSYFGGKKKAVEMHNKVRARVMSTAISQLVIQSDVVYIMGHKVPDMDAFGSCAGMYVFAKHYTSRVKIVLDDVVLPIESLYKDLTSRFPEIENDIISPEQAISQADESSLVIVLDNNRASSSEAPELLEITDRVVMVDHHRRGSDYIENPTLTYLEPYASSTSELVTELIQYADREISLPAPVADALLAGITVDTKSFTLQTGVRTFEAASVLKRYGADSINVKKLFRDSSQVVKTRSEIIANAKIYKNIIAISRHSQELESPGLIASQAADEMLDISGIKASFVMVRADDRIHISGRSLGDISVQLIMEVLGGGGHQSAAAAQIPHTDLDSCEEMLVKAIDNYLMEEDNESNIKN